MSSYLRRLARKIERNRPGYEPAPQPFIQTATGYETIHPTKGKRVVSMKRYAAQTAMAQALDRVLPFRRKAPPAPLYAYQKRKAPKVWPSNETRQQRRHAARLAAKAAA